MSICHVYFKLINVFGLVLFLLAAVYLDTSPQTPFFGDHPSLFWSTANLATLTTTQLGCIQEHLASMEIYIADQSIIFKSKQLWLCHIAFRELHNLGTKMIGIDLHCHYAESCVIRQEIGRGKNASV